MANTHVAVFDRASSQYAWYNGTAWKPEDDFTLFFRMKPASVPGVGEEYYVISKTGTANREIFAAWLEEDGYIHASIKDDSSTLSEVAWTNFAAPSGVWSAVAITCVISEATATERELFVGGISYGNGSVISGGAVNTLATGNGNVGVGARIVTPGKYFDGKLDELFVYDGILTQAEIAALQNSEADPAGGTVRGAWLFNNNWDDADGIKDLTPVNGPTFDSVDLPDFYVNAARAIVGTPTAGGIGLGV